MGGSQSAGPFTMAAFFSPQVMNHSLHETSDVYLAAYLLSQGATFTGCRRVGRRRNVFSFVADEKLHELLRLYWRNMPIALVPAQVFGCLRRLKSISRLPSKPSRGTEDIAAPLESAEASDDASHANGGFPQRPC